MPDLTTADLLLLLSLDAHNHVDDYSGTLGGVHKVHILALVTIKSLKLNYCTVILSLSKTKTKQKTH